MPLETDTGANLAAPTPSTAPGDGAAPARHPIMVSELKRFHLVDASGRSAQVADFTVDVLRDEHPAVTHVRYRSGAVGSRERALPWEQVTSIDWEARRFHVASLEAGARADADDGVAAARIGDVLLARDILDALILDLWHRRAARANDLAMEWQDGVLRLMAADLSYVAMLRRITRGRVGKRVVAYKLADWKYIEFLRGDPGAVEAGASYHRRIARLPPGEIARLVDALPYLHAAELLTLLPGKLAADTLEAMSSHRELQVYEELSHRHQLELLGLMAPDLAADLVRRLHAEAARTLLSGLDPGKAARVIELLRYPEDTVGGIMTNDILILPMALAIGEARETLREQLKEPDFIFFIYVVEDLVSRRLRGVLPLRTLIAAEGAAQVADLMNPYLVTLHALDPARPAAYRVLNSGLVALPVVGREARLLGAVTIDDAMAVVSPRAWGATEMRVFS